MKALAKRRLIIVAGCVFAMMCLAFYLVTENEYVASCAFSCSCSDLDSASGTETWRVEGYAKKFLGSASIQFLEQEFLKTNNSSRPLVHRAFESFQLKVENSSVPMVSILIRARDRKLAKAVVEFCVKSFADMLNERNRHVFEKHAARASVRIEKAKRRGEPVPEDALREIEAAKASLENENYRVADIQEIRVRFCGRRWR